MRAWLAESEWMEQLLAHLQDYWPGWVAFAGFLLALYSMAHALTRKRDARSAATWTALIWLAPFLGVLLYWLVGVNRIERRAQQMLPSHAHFGNLQASRHCPSGVEARFQGLVTLGGRLTGLPLTEGNLILPMEAPEAFRAMITAIDAARSEVYLSTYIFGNDVAGHQLVAALSRAVQRGVRVRVLVDGLGSLYSFPPAMYRLRRARIRAARFLYSFNPWRMRQMNLRNHRKLLVVDRRTGFTGGMNLRAGYIQEPVRIRDLHCQVQGPVVEHLLRTFVVDWMFSTGEVLDASLADDPVLPGRSAARGITSGPDSDLGKRRMMLLAAIGAAQQHIRIATPYFVPDQSLLAALSLAALRGVRVELLLPRHNNLRVLHWAALHVLPWLMRDGCRVLLTPAPFDHAKIMVVDGEWAMVGSGNWDARSLRLNFEFDLEVLDRQVAADLSARLDARSEGAHPLTLAWLREQPYPARLRNALCYLLEPYL